MNYTVKKENEIVTLLINGVEAMCPYKQDITVPTQSALGQVQMQIIKTVCNTNCPFADYIESGNVTQYSIECAGMAKFFDIDPETQSKDNVIIL
jgi:sulfatase maturation enzyme AslB (radical SAM superfamily)